MNSAPPKHWTPTIKDFKELADFEVAAWNAKFPGKAKAVELTNLQSLVSQIKLQADKTVVRVNIVTHAMGNLIALSGTVDRNNGDCFLGNWHDYDRQWDPYNHAGDIDPARTDVLDNSQGLFDQPFASNGWFNVLELGKPVRDAIRKKFADGAEIHLYACHTAKSGAFNTMLMNGIANTLNCFVYGFESAVYYHPTQGSGGITNRLITGVGTDEADAIAHENKGLVHNDARPQKKEYAPKKPEPP